jgi:hypothetical protein
MAEWHLIDQSQSGSTFELFSLAANAEPRLRVDHAFNTENAIAILGWLPRHNLVGLSP